jgi:hypothetical protein
VTFVLKRRLISGTGFSVQKFSFGAIPPVLTLHDLFIAARSEVGVTAPLTVFATFTNTFQATYERSSVPEPMLGAYLPRLFALASIVRYSFQTGWVTSGK